MAGSNDEATVLRDLADSRPLYFHRLGHEGDRLLEELGAVYSGEGALAERRDDGMTARSVVRTTLYAHGRHNGAVRCIPGGRVGSSLKNVRQCPSLPVGIG